jgi:Fic family protein
MPAMTYKAGSYRQHDNYKCFLPSSVNTIYEWKDKRITPALAEAMHAVGELNAASLAVPDLEAFLFMYITKEAVTSSHIEGTKTNIEDALLPEEELAPEKRNDWQEVKNYMDAMSFAIKKLEKLPLSMRLIRDTHRVLMQGVRGSTKNPGEVRTVQNWIGGPSPDKARYVPPHFVDIPDLFTDLERFWHNTAIDTPALIRAGISHYQFESIHPFLDGNGRTGRLLITLYLMHAGLLSTPTLYLSAFFDTHRDDYFDALNRVRKDDDLDFWLLFFLAGVTETAKDARRTLTNIMVLQKRYEELITDTFGKRTDVALRFLHYLFSHPMVQVKNVIEALSITKPSANSLVAKFAEVGLLKEMTGQKKNRIFSLWEYVDLFDSTKN